MCCMHPQQLFWNALLYSFAFNITGSCLVEPHLVKSLQLSQAFCHHPKVFPLAVHGISSLFLYGFLWEKRAFANCFFSRTLWGHVLELNMFLMTVLSAQKGKENLSRVGFRYLRTCQAPNKQQPFGSNVTHHPSCWSCTISLFWPNDWWFYFLIAWSHQITEGFVMIVCWQHFL